MKENVYELRTTEPEYNNEEEEDSEERRLVREEESGVAW